MVDIVEKDLKHRCGLEKYREIAFLDDDNSLPVDNQTVRHFIKDIMIVSKRFFPDHYHKLDDSERFSILESKLKSDDYKQKFWPQTEGD